MRSLLLGCVCLVLVGATASADEGVPADVLTEIKGATVFVKVDAGAVQASGSGFVIKVDGETAWVVTNHHVVAPQVDGGRRIGPRPAANPTVAVVFNSGTKKEQEAKATVAASDPERDLAVLRSVTKVKDLPQPLDLGQDVKLVETMTVYILGFPFGELLSANKGNPALTIGKGTISSFRQDGQGELARIQVDGAINSGNSGGPVVDGKGRLIGVSVAAIRGSQIGLVIPSAHLAKMLRGRADAANWSTKKVENGTAEFAVDIHLIDPHNKLKDVSFHFVSEDAVKDKPKDGVLLPGAHHELLKIENQKATGTFNIRATDKGLVKYLYQVSFVDGDGKTVVLPSKGFQIDFSGKTLTTSADNNRTGADLGKISDNAVVLQITGVPDDATRQYILDKLPKLADKGPNQVFRSRQVGPMMTITLAPVADPKAFAQKIDFGTVDKIDDRFLTITAKKMELPVVASPLPAADPLAKLFADLKSGNHFQRQGAADQLVKTEVKQRSAEACKALAAMLDDPDAAVRANAVRVLGFWAHKESVPALVKLLDSDQADTRRAALEALGRCRDPKTIEAVAKRLANPQDRGSASKALQWMGPAAESAVLPYLKNTDWGVSAEACQILRVVGGKDSVTPLQELVWDKASFLFRSSAEEALECVKGRAEPRP